MDVSSETDEEPPLKRRKPNEIDNQQMNESLQQLGCIDEQKKQQTAADVSSDTTSIDAEHDDEYALSDNEHLTDFPEFYGNDHRQQPSEIPFIHHEDDEESETLEYEDETEQSDYKPEDDDEIQEEQDIDETQHFEHQQIILQSTNNNRNRNRKRKATEIYDSDKDYTAPQPKKKRKRGRPKKRGRRAKQKQKKQHRSSKEQKNRKRRMNRFVERESTQFSNSEWRYRLFEDKQTEQGWKFRMTQNGLQDFDETKRKYKASDIGEMNHICKHCKARLFKNETTRKSFCCQRGKLRRFMPRMDRPPEFLYNLLIGNNAMSKFFGEHIFSINSALAMSKIKLTRKELPSGLQKFILSGRVAQSTMQFAADQSANRAMFYTHKPDEQTEKRVGLSFIRKLNKNQQMAAVMNKLQPLLQKHNYLIRAFTTIWEENVNSNGFENLCMKIQSNVMPGNKEHYKNYAAPGADFKKLATLVPIDENRASASHQQIYFTSRQSGVDRTVVEDNALYDPLQYVVFHPRGESGWSQGFKKENGITARQYYRYQLFERDGEWNPFIHGKELFEAYITNQWAKVQQIEMNQIASDKIQKKCRADCYANIAKAKEEGIDLSSIGVKANILPSTFKGSPRYMSRRTQDALGMMRQFRTKPDLFITFTANSKWPEIAKAIAEHKHLDPIHRDDIIARVFNAKLHQLLDDLTKKHVLGQVIGYVYVVEYQKRGLPHAHILLLLHPNSKFDKDPKKYDEIVSAELPNPETHPLLYELVVEHMIHGPCSLYQHCLGPFGCKKFFPKPFREKTANSLDGYPLYKRRSPEDGGFTCTKEKYGKTAEADNSYVIPYNPALLLKYRCHINVEICATIAAIKYLYKYIFKGSDKTFIQINSLDSAKKYDECGQFVNCRFFGAAESCWRLFGFTTDKQKPSCKDLTVHLPQKQYQPFTVHVDDDYREDEDDPHMQPTTSTQNDDMDNRTKLTEYFVNNKLEKETPLSDERRGCFIDGTLQPHGFNLLYHEYPQFYNWKVKDKKWSRRTQQVLQPTISRMHYVNYKEHERYFLRVLLLHKRGAISFEDLRTIDGKQCATFREACSEYGLLNDDKIWIETLQEATSVISSPSALRRLFACILNNNPINDANALWMKFRDRFTDDIKVQYYTSESPQTPKEDWIFTDRMYNEALFRIQELLFTTEQTDDVLEAHGLPQPDQTERIIHHFYCKDIRKEMAFDKELQKRSVATNLQKMNIEQKNVYNAIINAIDDPNNAQKFFFLQAKAGTGKTFVLNTIASYVRSKGEIALCNATSGIASNLFPCGMTMHSRFKIPLDCKPSSALTITRQSHRAELIRNAKIIIWDEAPMSHKNMLLWLNKQLKDIMNNDLPFGGKILILAGDFQQVPPVIPNASKHVVINSSIRNCRLFENATRLHLHRNERLRKKLRELKANGASQTQIFEEENKITQFEQWLNSVGDNTIQHHTQIHPDAIEMQAQYVVPAQQTKIEQFVKRIYPDLNANKGDKQYLQSKCILSPKNKSIDEINQYLLEQIDNEETRTYYSTDSVGLDDCSELFSDEFLHSRNFSGIPPHELTLKTNIPIILIRNIDSDAGLCNGTRMLIKKLHTHSIEAVKLDDPTNQTYLIPRIPLTPAKKIGYEFIRKTFPVRIAFAMTINKSQGQTLDEVSIYLPEPVFEHGQLYVALSRCADPTNMQIIIKDTETQGFMKQTQQWITHNIVYRQLLL